MNGNGWIGFLAGLCLLFACASVASDDDERVGGETHWLGGCESDADCDRGSCLCGVCTVACTEASACGQEFDSACVATSSLLLDGHCASPPDSVCLAACSGDSDCPSGTTCTSGTCLSTSPSDTSTGGSGGAMPTTGGAGGSTGGVGGASGGTSGAGATGGAPPGGSGGTSDNVCDGSRTFPPPPSPPTPNGNVGEFSTALYTVDFGDRDPNLDPPPAAYLDLGWDIDGTCTTADDLSAGECVLPAFSSGNVDGPQGVDNALGAILQRIRQTMPTFSSETATQALQAGEMGLLFRVRGYNGEENDERVNVAVFGRSPFDTTNGAGSAPRWDGTDVWPVTSDSVTDPNATVPLEAPAYEDDRAYVVAGHLVAVFPRLSIPWRLPIATTVSWRLQMNLTRVVLTCTIGLDEQLRGTLTNCNLGARWETDDLLHQASQLSDPTSADGQTPLCTDNGLYSVFKGQICSRTDALQLPGIGMQECDALSVGFTFETQPALLGDLWVLDEVLPRCPEAIEPSNDSCAQ